MNTAMGTGEVGQHASISQGGATTTGGKHGRFVACSDESGGARRSVQRLGEGSAVRTDVMPRSLPPHRQRTADATVRSITSCHSRRVWSRRPDRCSAPGGRSRAVEVPRCRARERAACRRRGRADRPRNQVPSGTPNPCFRRSRISGGRSPAATACSTCLRRPPCDLHRRRQRGRELDDVVVEQRHARLDRVRHAHAIDLRQDVLRQIGLEVEAHHLARPRQVPASRSNRPAGASLRDRRPAARAEVRRVEQRRASRRGWKNDRRPGSAPRDRATTWRRKFCPRTPCGSSGQAAAATGASAAARQPVERRDARVRQVALVAAEQLVAAVARQHHGDVPARHLRDVPGRDRRRVGERLVEVRDEAVDELDARPAGRRTRDGRCRSGRATGARMVQLVERAARRSRSRRS